MGGLDFNGDVLRQLRIHRAGEDHCIATWNNVLLTTWRGAINADGLESTHGISFDLAAAFRQGIVVYNVIEKGIPMPSNELRKRAAEILHDTGGHVRKTSTVVLGDGFWVSTARAAIATITLFARTPHPQKVFASLGEGADWVEHDLFGTHATRDGLVAVGERIRQIDSLDSSGRLTPA
jgi:hypothetical protein